MDFRVLAVLLNKGPLRANTIGPKVHLTPGSISVAVRCLACLLGWQVLSKYKGFQHRGRRLTECSLNIQSLQSPEYSL